MLRLAITFGGRDHRPAFSCSAFSVFDRGPASNQTIFLWINFPVDQLPCEPHSIRFGRIALSGTSTNFDNHAFIRPQMDSALLFCRLAVEVAPMST